VRIVLFHIVKHAQSIHLVVTIKTLQGLGEGTVLGAILRDKLAQFGKRREQLQDTVLVTLITVIGNSLNLHLFKEFYSLTL
jgi:hypothetical protein